MTDVLGIILRELPDWGDEVTPILRAVRLGVRDAHWTDAATARIAAWAMLRGPRGHVSPSRWHGLPVAPDIAAAARAGAIVLLAAPPERADGRTPHELRACAAVAGSSGPLRTAGHAPSITLARRILTMIERNRDVR